MIPLGALAGSRHVPAAKNFKFLGGGETAMASAAALTVTDLSLGQPAPDRVIVALIGRRVAQGRALTSVTIGGVTATIDAKSPSWDSAIIARAVVPTGTTGDVTITLNGNEYGPRYVDLYAHYGAVAVLSASSAFSGGTPQTSTTVNPAKAGGDLLAVAHSSAAIASVTWAWGGHTQAGSRDTNNSHASHIYAPSVAAGSQTVVATSSGATRQGLAAVVYDLT